MGRLPAHPEPPDDFNSRDLPLIVPPRPWWRLHRCSYGPIHFGRSGNNRFDAAGGEQGAYGLLYAAIDVYGAFIETLGRATGTNRVDMQALRDTCVARIESAHALRLIDLTGSGLAWLGADERLCVGDDYGLCARWALAFYLHPQQPDGLYFRARHDPMRHSLALFDRPGTVQAIQAYSEGTLADVRHATLVANILDTYLFQLLP